MSTAVPATRRRGRPPKDAASVPTVERLLDAAAAACIELGYDGATVADIAARAGVTPTAIYNHFPRRSEVLVAAARRALDEIDVLGTMASAPPAQRARATVRAFLAPEFVTTRRLLAELHLAGRRNPDLAALLAVWHLEQAERWAPLFPGRRPARLAATKAFFLILLGSCLIESLEGIDAPMTMTTRSVERAAEALLDQGGHP